MKGAISNATAFVKPIKPHLVDELAATHDKQQKDLDSMVGNENGIHAMEVHQTAKSLAPNDTCLVFEGADFGFYGAAYWPATSKDRWFTNGVMGMLGWAIPFGIGAQVALPQSKVLVFAGDGSFGFNGLEIDTAVRHNIPAIILIGNDSVWGIDYHQQKQFFGQSIATELLPNTRYDLIAKALGAKWQTLSIEDRVPYADKSKKDKERYEEEMDKYNSNH